MKMKRNVFIIISIVLVSVFLIACKTKLPVGRKSFPCADPFIVYDKDGHKFSLWMNKDDVVAQLGEPNSAEETDYFSPANDTYNVIYMKYDSGIEFMAMKGSEKIIYMSFMSGTYQASADKIAPKKHMMNDVKKSYGFETDMNYMKKEDGLDLSTVVYVTREKKFIVTEAYKSKQMFGIYFDFDLKTEQCEKITLVSFSGK